MNFLIHADTDIGISRKANQDSLSVKILSDTRGDKRMVLAVLCDGMGGLSRGELASASVVRAFDRWAMDALPAVLANTPAGSDIEDSVIRAQWGGLITEQDKSIKSYGKLTGAQLGTTVVALLLTDRRYYILNVGDSRAYELRGGIRQLTNDQTVVSREVALGRMTEDEARLDPRRNVLLQCIGAGDDLSPEFLFGPTEKGATYLLCSDGFRHEVTPEEMWGSLRPDYLPDESTMSASLRSLIDLNMARGEKDNISAVLVRTL